MVAAEECYGCGDVFAACDQDEDVYAAGGDAGGGLGDQCVAGVVGGKHVVEGVPAEVRARRK